MLPLHWDGQRKWEVLWIAATIGSEQCYSAGQHPLGPDRKEILSHLTSATNEHIILSKNKLSICVVFSSRVEHGKHEGLLTRWSPIKEERVVVGLAESSCMRGIAAKWVQVWNLSASRHRSDDAVDVQESWCINRHGIREEHAPYRVRSSSRSQLNEP